MNYQWLKKTRVIVSLLFFVGLFIIVNDLYELIPEQTTQWFLYPQFIPSLLKFIQITAFSATGFIVIMLLTFLVGRIYCSSICPLGILQDIFAWIAKKRSSKKLFYKSKKANKLVRYAFLALTFAGILTGFSLLVTLLDPYSHATRIFTYLFKPFVSLANNGIAEFAQKAEWYSIFKVEIITAPAMVLLLTIASMLGIAWFSYKRGRLICNTICPVGTTLGLLSRYSIFKIKIDASTCTRCAKCIGVCKSECIDLKTYAIDHSRCVDCFNCLTVCPEKAVDFKSVKPIEKKSVGLHTPNDRRQALATMALLVIGSKLLATPRKTNKKGTHVLLPEEKEFPVSPPGSRSIARFNEICTACGLCVSVCPSQVLRPATKQYGIIGFMQPHMDYYKGQCTFDCTRCGDVCPTGAILPLTMEEKHVAQLGKAVFLKENCVVYTDETACGACSEHCPTKAVNMVPYKGSLVIPKVDQDLCIGCGACEHPCPLEPGYKAIYINGNPHHLVAKKPKEEENKKISTDEFAF